MDNLGAEREEPGASAAGDTGQVRDKQTQQLLPQGSSLKIWFERSLKQSISISQLREHVKKKLAGHSAKGGGGRNPGS